MIQLIVVLVAVLTLTLGIIVAMTGTQIAEGGSLTDFNGILMTGVMLYMRVAIPLLFIVSLSEGYRRFISPMNKQRLHEVSSQFKARVMRLLAGMVGLGVLFFVVVTIATLLWTVVQYAWSS